ncbi:MAG: SIMPL domain-containing protein [Alphaproteobacteria bacterium]
MTPNFRFLTILAASLGVAALMIAGSADAQEPDRTRRMTITAAGTVTAEPDMATLSLGVVTDGRTAAAALAANTAAMTGIVATLKGAGIAARDLQTSGFNINPRYTHPPRRTDGQQAAPQIAGYSVHNSLNVRIRDLAQTGAVLDVVVGLAAGVELGDILSIDEAGGGAPRPVPMAARMESLASDAPVPIEAGELTFRQQVRIVWEIE